MTLWGIVAVLAAWYVIVAWRRQKERVVRTEPWEQTDRRTDGQTDQDNGIDRAELEQAERDVRDMPKDLKGRPLDDVVGDDWGPGSPKPPYM